ncbi:MAG: type II secretion system protein GspM [Solirubrobacteraceae bacterium]
MTGRDRIVIMVIVVAVLLGAVWVEVVSPERKQASQLDGQVASAQSQLASAEGQAASARNAESQYAAAYTATVALGKAVPPSQEVASLIDQLTRASAQKDVYFSSISNGGSSASATAATSPSVASAGLSQLPFTFTFEGSYFDLEHLFSQLADFTKVGASGEMEVSGRLLTIRSVSLTPVSSGSGTGPSGNLSGSITATAYVLPGQSLTGSATAVSPTGAGPSATTSSSPVSPAVVKVNP